MNVYGSTPGFPLPDNKCRGQASREGQGGPPSPLAGEGRGEGKEMPALDPVCHASSVMPGQTGRQNGGGHAMNVYGSTPGFPLPDNKCRG